MKLCRFVAISLLSLAFLAAAGTPAYAQAKVEVGASLMSALVGLNEEDDITSVGIPSGGFNIVNPGLYASLFLGSHLAIEPQVGVLWTSFDGDSFHVVNLVGQFDYFISGITQPSLYLFANGGVVSVSDADYTPKSFGAGAGYRIPVGDRLTFRVDGRYTRFTSGLSGGEGNVLAFSLSIGGLFGGQ